MYRPRQIRKQRRNHDVDFPRLPNVVLIAKEIDVGFHTVEELKERARDTQAFFTMPLAKLDAHIPGRFSDNLTRVISRVIVQPMQRDSGRILGKGSNLSINEASAVVGCKENCDIGLLKPWHAVTPSCFEKLCLDGKRLLLLHYGFSGTALRSNLANLARTDASGVMERGIRARNSQREREVSQRCALRGDE